MTTSDCDLEPRGNGFACKVCGWTHPVPARHNCLGHPLAVRPQCPPPSGLESRLSQKRRLGLIEVDEIEIERRLAVCRDCDRYSGAGDCRDCRGCQGREQWIAWLCRRIGCREWQIEQVDIP
jgi:hypothetical protein